MKIDASRLAGSISGEVNWKCFRKLMSYFLPDKISSQKSGC